MKITLIIILSLFSLTSFADVIYINQGECKYINGAHVCASNNKVNYNSKKEHYIFEQRYPTASACHCNYTIADIKVPTNMPKKGYWLIMSDKTGQKYLENFGGGSQAKKDCQMAARQHAFCLRRL